MKSRPRGARGPSKLFGLVPTSMDVAVTNLRTALPFDRFKVLMNRVLRSVLFGAAGSRAACLEKIERHVCSALDELASMQTDVGMLPPHNNLGAMEIEIAASLRIAQVRLRELRSNVTATAHRALPAGRLSRAASVKPRATGPWDGANLVECVADLPWVSGEHLVQLAVVCQIDGPIRRNAIEGAEETLEQRRQKWKAMLSRARRS